MTKDFKTLTEFTDYFTEENCHKYFEATRFKNGDYCPHCGHDKIMRFSNGKRYRCNACRKDFSIRTGTIFDSSRLPLRKWFMAIYLLTTHKKGISSIWLAEQLKVEQRTAWYMDMRIREALKQGDNILGGTVEVDETYIGGKHVRKDAFKKKAPVFGMKERGGQIKAFAVPHRGTEVLLPTMRKHIDPKARIMSDEARVYKKLPRTGYQHGSVKHGKKHWAHGDINTNSIESFWALFKRGYHGTYHSMSKKHLQRYVDEFAFRFNSRGEDISTLFALATERVAESGKLPYKTLIA